MTATVASTTGEGTPTGTVTFLIDGQAQAPVTLALVDGQGQAILPPISDLLAGDHTITADYSGDDTFAVSTASPLIQTVTALVTTTTLSSSVNPSTFGQSVTFTATVAPTAGAGVPTGTVTFSIDGDAQAPVTLMMVDGQDQASLPPSTELSGGSQIITAVYNGDGTFAASMATPLTQVVSAIATTTQLTTSLNPSLFSQSITFMATVTPGSGAIPPAGMVNFFDGTTPIGSGSLDVNDQAIFTDPSLAAGAHTITASYGGNGSFTPSDAALLQTVSPVPTSTSLVTAPNASGAGQAVTLTATVSGVATPGGSVRFDDGTTVLGTAALDSHGVASLVINSLTPGTHSLTSLFAATANFLGSTSNPVSQVVTVVAADAPLTVVSFQRFGFHAQPTILVLGFSEALNPGPAQDVHDYHVVLKSGTANTGGVVVGGGVELRRAVYDAATNSVMLFTSPRINIHDIYQITVNAMSPNGLTSATGVALAGRGAAAGTTFVAPITFRTLAGRFTVPLPAALRQSKNPAKAISKLSTAALDALIDSDDVSIRSGLAARQRAFRKSLRYWLRVHH